jgi:hypothetical protein
MLIATYCFCCIASASLAQNANSKNSSSTLIQQMVGTWLVEQRMWPAFGTKPITLPAAVARRRLMDGGFLEEVMEPANKSANEGFVRNAFFNYNAVNQQYEYFSLDSRAPQMMNERSDKTDEQKLTGRDGIILHGGSFVAPQWGEAKNVAFTYRLKIGEIKNNIQKVELYLTPQGPENAKEFLAFEYVYTRER